MGQGSAVLRFRAQSERAKWYKASEVLDSRVVNIEQEVVLLQYYGSYIKQCELHLRDSLNFTINDEFQSCVDSLNENHSAKVFQISKFAKQRLHDVLAYCVDIIDGVWDVEKFVPVDVVSGVGAAYVHGGFFYFLWADIYGEKFGRAELNCCRHLMELQTSLLHVPLTYHFVYKGRGVTVQGLVPIHRTNTPINPRDFPEVVTLLQEICSCFNYKPFEEKGETHFAPPDAQIHIGLDGRLYFVSNYCWRTPFPVSPRGRGEECLHRFTYMRLDILVDTDAVSLRAFHRHAFVSENADAMQIVKLLMDAQLHEVPRIACQAGEDPYNILTEFRKQGYNQNLLGFLLLSMLRNRNPPALAAEVVFCEITARAIKQYVIMQVSKSTKQPVLLSTWRDSTIWDSGGKNATETDQTEDTGAVDDLFEAVGSFLDIVSDVLVALLQYPGQEIPREATHFAPAVAAPRDIFGGEVIPIMYSKFRLLLTDVNFYQVISPEAKYRIYQRSCEMLGVIVNDGAISRVMPVLSPPGVPLQPLSSWVKRRLEFIAAKLFVPHSPRQLWVQHGMCLTILLRQQPVYWRYFDQCHRFLSSLSTSFPGYHVLQGSVRRQALLDVIEWRRRRVREHHQPSSTAQSGSPHAIVQVSRLEKLLMVRSSEAEESSVKQKCLDKNLLIYFLRKGAAAAADEGDFTNAIMYQGEAFQLAKENLQEFGIPYTTFFRFLSQELQTYFALDIEEEKGESLHQRDVSEELRRQRSVTFFTPFRTIQKAAVVQSPGLQQPQPLKDKEPTGAQEEQSSDISNFHFGRVESSSIFYHKDPQNSREEIEKKKKQREQQIKDVQKETSKCVSRFCEADTLSAMSELEQSAQLFRQGRFEEAETELRRCARNSERLLSKHDPKYIRMRANMAVVKAELHFREHAINILREICSMALSAANKNLREETGPLISEESVGSQNNLLAFTQTENALSPLLNASGGGASSGSPLSPSSPHPLVMDSTISNALKAVDIPLDIFHALAQLLEDDAAEGAMKEGEKQESEELMEEAELWREKAKQLEEEVLESHAWDPLLFLSKHYAV